MRRQLLPLATIFSLVLPLPLASGQNSGLVEHLRDEYKGKTFVLRGFYSNDRLRYNSIGTLVRGANAGDWTGDGFVLILDFFFSHKRLVIDAQRVEVVIDHKEFHLRPVTQTAQDGGLIPVRVETKVDLGEQDSVVQFDDAISKIFLSSKDHISDLIPDYWKPCVPAGLIGRNEICRFSKEILAIPGVASAVESSSADYDNYSLKAASQIFHVGNGVSPPRSKYSPEPEFSEPARRTKYQGTLALGMTVNEKGMPMNIHILSPLGAGLDAKAVRAVEKWKFEPAEKDGHPVAVEIAVEVDFHLY